MIPPPKNRRMNNLKRTCARPRQTSTSKYERLRIFLEQSSVGRPQANCGDILWCLRFCNKYIVDPCMDQDRTAYLWRLAFRVVSFQFHYSLLRFFCPSQSRTLPLFDRVSGGRPAGCVCQSIRDHVRHMATNAQRRRNFKNGSIEDDEWKYFASQCLSFEECPQICPRARTNQISTITDRHLFRAPPPGNKSTQGMTVPFPVSSIWKLNFNLGEFESRSLTQIPSWSTRQRWNALCAKSLRSNLMKSPDSDNSSPT